MKKKSSGSTQDSRTKTQDSLRPFSSILVDGSERAAARAADDTDPPAKSREVFETIFAAGGEP